MTHAPDIMPSKKTPAAPPPQPSRAGRKRTLSEAAVSTSVRLEPETVEALNDAVHAMRKAGEKTTVGELMRSIIEAWVDGTSPPPKP